jgi:hypothetical protein
MDAQAVAGQRERVKSPANLDCGGKRSATPLAQARGALTFPGVSPVRERRRRGALPAQSKGALVRAKITVNPPASLGGG